MRYLLALASLSLLVAMLPGLPLGGLFAISATAFGLILMLLPDGSRAIRIGVGITILSLALGVSMILGTWPGEESADDLRRLGALLLFFWILPLIVLSLAHGRSRHPEHDEADEAGEADEGEGGRAL